MKTKRKTISVEIKDNSKRVKEELEAACLKALEECGLVAEGNAKGLCPVDTGLLRNSITHALAGQSPAITEYKADKGSKKGSYSGTAPDDGKNEYSVYIGTNVEYAQLVEVGSSKRKAKAYLKPAIADYADTFKAIIEKELK